MGRNQSSTPWLWLSYDVPIPNLTPRIPTKLSRHDKLSAITEGSKGGGAGHPRAVHMKGAKIQRIDRIDDKPRQMWQSGLQQAPASGWRCLNYPMALGWSSSNTCSLQARPLFR